MRDYLVTLVVLGSLPYILARPHIGVIMWSWLAYMNPHRLCWGFAVNMPFAQMVAIATLVATLLSREPKRIPWTRETVTLVIFTLWMGITTIFALQPDDALPELERVIKIQLMTFVTLMIMVNRERLHLLAWTIVASLGFYGIKGGIFTILTGGAYHVQGPSGSFISGNNELGLAMLMALPMIRYLQLEVSQKWLRLGLMTAIFLTIVAILGTQSRGAFIGLATVGFFLIWKSPKRFAFLMLMIVALPIALNLMPDTWWERMESILDYEEDASAMGRINAWWFAFNLAIDRPIGGGFDVFTQPWFGIYAPDPENVHDAHSIWFEVMGEHGIIGLVIFVMLGIFTWRTGTWIIKHTRGISDLVWASNLARMLQVSLVAYASAGTFLGLAYFDLYYHIVAMVVICKLLVVKELSERQKQKEISSASCEARRQVGILNTQI